MKKYLKNGRKESSLNYQKKGDLENCNNWRGVTLLSVPSKVLGRVIIVRIRDALDNKLRKEQAGGKDVCSKFSY